MAGKKSDSPKTNKFSFPSWIFNKKLRTPAEPSELSRLSMLRYHAMFNQLLGRKEDSEESGKKDLLDSQEPPSQAIHTKPCTGERRKSLRVGLITQVESLVDGFWTLGRSQDISDGGLMIATAETLDRGTGVVVRFNMPPYPPGVNIQSRGVVAWVRSREAMGIRFVHLNDHKRQAIVRYIQLEGRITQLGPL